MSVEEVADSVREKLDVDGDACRSKKMVLGKMIYITYPL